MKNKYALRKAKIKVIKKLVKANPVAKIQDDYFYHFYYKDKTGQVICFDMDTLK